eukprot:TRINITY_DN3195_c0_g1_i2.p1 TRINITY_DN3195_c0_g1~~TRINITY_DN3195_c0_g1_i2.p1  ORF type:complete len:129 (-),score=26.21 TRINITY_DN3195_c0_g1_i2:322-708(-)
MATRNEYRFKVIVIGSLGAGKTSIIRRFVTNQFSYNYKSTIGVDFASKVIDYDRQTRIHLQLWDVAGQERFGSMTHLYYKDAVGVVLVCDATNESSFEALEEWKNDFLTKMARYSEVTTPIVVMANKV